MVNFLDYSASEDIGVLACIGIIIFKSQTVVEQNLGGFGENQCGNIDTVREVSSNQASDGFLNLKE